MGPAEVTAPLAPVLSREDLIRHSNATLQLCITEFYRDDWPQVLQMSSRLEELAQRWRERTAQTRDGRVEWEVDGLAAAVKKLRAGADSHDVLQTTKALREISARMGTLQKLP